MLIIFDIIFWGALKFFSFKKMKNNPNKLKLYSCIMSTVLCVFYIVQGVLYVL